MFGNLKNFLKKFSREEKKDSKDTAKERLHLVLMQDRANVSADFMELMKQEIIEVIKKYIDIDENAIDVKLTNKVNGDGTTGAPILYANIPILNVKDDTKQVNIERNKENDESKKEDSNKEKVKEEKKTQNKEKNKKNEKEPKKEKVSEEKKESVKTEKTKKEDNSEESVDENSDNNMDQEDEDTDKNSENK